MNARLAILGIAFALSLLLRWLAPAPSALDEPLMNTAGGQFGAWFATFTICLVVVGVLYLIGKGVSRLLRKR